MLNSHLCNLLINFYYLTNIKFSTTGSFLHSAVDNHYFQHFEFSHFCNFNIIINHLCHLRQCQSKSSWSVVNGSIILAVLSDSYLRSLLHFIFTLCFPAHESHRLSVQVSKLDWQRRKKIHLIFEHGWNSKYVLTSSVWVRSRLRKVTDAFTCYYGGKKIIL